MLLIPLWKRVLILGVCALGVLLAMPNLFYSRVEGHNDALVALDRSGALSAEQELQLAAWPDWLPSGLVNLGLDLRGGAHLLAEVHVSDVYADRMDGLWPEVRDVLRDLRDSVGTIRRIDGTPGELHVRIERPGAMAEAVAAVRELAQPVVTLTGVGQSDLEVEGRGDLLIVRLSEAERQATDDRTMQQSLEIIRRRVDEVGTREPTIQRQGADRILIQVPGIGSAAELKALIGTTARLTFHPVVRRTSDAGAAAGLGNRLLPSMDEEGQFYVVESAPVVSGEELVDARPDFDQNNRPAVSFRFNPAGARKFGDYTAANIGQPFAIVLDEEVISAPVIQAHISGGSGIITGSFTVEESTNLAVLLRAGALPAGMTFLEERTIGPELGQDSVEAGRIAALVGMVAVVAFMIASYGLFGIFASLALSLNVGLIFGTLSAIGATLTLPGIAGIVLTIGMAVDANVLVFERIREEMKVAKGPARAIELGYEKALSAIIDANITTFIVASILFFLGSGPVKGFAVTLGIGILTSVFTAIFVTRLIVVTWFERTRPKTVLV
ncbi:MAG: protein translocase subunit SecD [Rhodobacteraceae bacterium]|nr:protein translocase subunit SecD [Paracoccaceae bacterium]